MTLKASTLGFRARPWQGPVGWPQTSSGQSPVSLRAQQEGVRVSQEGCRGSGQRLFGLTLVFTLDQRHL